ncbi:MAG: UDP-N-acetylmuramate--L-alanine ligase [Gammaproteobacteria bacterium]
MQAERMGQIRRIHCVGIGGTGMNGVAEVLHNLGYEVSGSDRETSRTTERLSALGIPVVIGHRAEAVANADVVVISSAIGTDNVELEAARARRIPIIPRAEMLAELMRFRYGIAVAGSHGKTTTTALIASILVEAGEDPTFVIGGRLNSVSANARLGSGRYLVAEADESDASFLLYQPLLAVVTNIDRDHLSTYQGDFNRLREAFHDFLHHLPFYGVAVLCLDDPEIGRLLPRLARPVVSYGFSASADVRAVEVVYEGLQTRIRVMRRSRPEAEFRVNLVGRHNATNALAAIAVAGVLELPDASVARALAGFAGTGRRFQFHGSGHFGTVEFLLVEDYAHHPREIEATLAAADLAWPSRRKVVVFQPHRYSRTFELMDDFSRVLSRTSSLVLTEVYPAGETPRPTADGRALSRAVRARGQADPIFAERISDIPKILSNIVRPDDLVLLLGAGDWGGVIPELLQRRGEP